ncbi:hypothetical protein [Alloalcanivorax xenomutans]|uniref:S1 family peptidase n=1 Tax=Alloalcanivorax xenomutans TaxID=1094342 RepID=A0A9Q3ZI48_9GAMM|nr:hypothetical protein [Alloalcanivorax xenomutans]KYZ86117.1 hypothetical protein A3Q32_18565 [Alcanivorax sp. KX64203]MCE7510392.1 S1 family peptidase [Alloalcanivorax xenomutans]WOA33392.1 hypothetical protein RVY87_09965 [Alloalcanivorax xenomutans]WOD27699.1 hypothetical protein RYH70_16965 [Alloalcanivorax xenomutans]
MWKNVMKGSALAVLVWSVSGTGLANELTSEEFEKGLKAEAAQFSKIYSINEDEALHRLKWQAAAGDVVARLRDQYQNRLAGLYIEHAPTERIVVRLKGNERVASRAFNVSDEQVAVEFVVGAPHTQAELQQAIATNPDTLKATFPGLQGTHTDPRTGEVVLTVLGGDKESRQMRSKAESASQDLGVPVRVRTIPVPLERQAVRGSGSLDMGCTTAFVVKRTTGTTTGVTTAAHCGPGNANYTGVDGASAALTYQARSFTARNDEQWYTSTATEEPKFYANSTTTPRTLTGRRTQASTAVGNNFCHYGSTTGYSCGDVDATDFQPTSYTCGPASNPVPCDATWISMVPPSSGTGLACAGGDSGGPWFVSTVATGIHSAGASTGTGIGDCLLAVYQSTDRLSSLGLQLLYGP